MNSNPYHFSSTSTVVSSDASGQSAPAAGRYSRFRTTLITVIVWQLTCLLIAKVYDHFIVDLIVAGYSLIYGDTEDSYRTFARFAPHIALLVVTLSATIVTLPVIEKLAGCRASGATKTLCAVRLGNSCHGSAGVVIRIKLLFFAPHDRLVFTGTNC